MLESLGPEGATRSAPRTAEVEGQGRGRAARPSRRGIWAARSARRERWSSPATAAAAQPACARPGAKCRVIGRVCGRSIDVQPRRARRDGDGGGRAEAPGLPRGRAERRGERSGSADGRPPWEPPAGPLLGEGRSAKGPGALSRALQGGTLSCTAAPRALPQPSPRPGGQGPHACQPCCGSLSSTPRMCKPRTPTSAMPTAPRCLQVGGVCDPGRPAWRWGVGKGTPRPSIADKTHRPGQADCEGCEETCPWGLQENQAGRGRWLRWPSCASRAGPGS